MSLTVCPTFSPSGGAWKIAISETPPVVIDSDLVKPSFRIA
ncbi:MAG TPA: hypothetical protein PKY67_10565 [Nitrosomonas sp.]|nr:hypothetical protein [Nitrosomonas sp.]